jgi:hypothetical protein
VIVSQSSSGDGTSTTRTTVNGKDVPNNSTIVNGALVSGNTVSPPDTRAQSSAGSNAPNSGVSGNSVTVKQSSTVNGVEQNTGTTFVNGQLVPNDYHTDRFED